eukprot:scaffold2338_cov301-Prasinococcus_capsulatus_cf.AAC.2
MCTQAEVAVSRRAKSVPMLSSVGKNCGRPARAHRNGKSQHAARAHARAAGCVGRTCAQPLLEGAGHHERQRVRLPGGHQQHHVEHRQRHEEPLPRAARAPAALALPAAAQRRGQHRQAQQAAVHSRRAEARRGQAEARARCRRCGGRRRAHHASAPACAPHVPGSAGRAEAAAAATLRTRGEASPLP